MSQTSKPAELSGLYAHCQFCGHTVSLALATAPTQVHRLKCAHCGFKAAEIRQRHPDGHSSTLARSCLGCSQSIPPARLQAQPTAPYCLDCQTVLEAGGTPPNETLPRCPKCDGAMAWRVRESKRPRHWLLGCRNYPSCDGVRAGSF